MPESTIRQVLRELRRLAWEAELGEALLPIAERMDAWRRGEASAFQVSDEIHRFHDGASREIWKTYQSRDTEMLLAKALADGYLRREQVPNPVYAVLEPHVARLASSRAAWESSELAPPGEEAEPS
ncbi:MAG: hypothetical protein KY467_03755 [Gemmatimonadetes bacterium]|nr:hypothetical protein [Gemmatimonadota bacterium]